MTGPLAIIDLGSNSTKMLVGRVRAGRVETVHFARATTRLAHGLDRSGRIDAAAAERTTRAATRFVRTARRLGAVKIIAAGTHAFRAAANGRAVADRIGRAAGVSVRILSGREEAMMAYRSARAVFPRHPRALVMLDIGGGSTELVVARSERLLLARTLPLGALRLTERYLTRDPIDPAEYAHMLHEIDARLARAWRDARGIRARDVDIVVSGGSARTAVDMIRGRPVTSRAHVHSVSLAALRRLERACLARTCRARALIPGLPRDRADIIPAGIAVLIGLLTVTGKRSLRAHDGGVREGLLLAYWE